MAKVHLWVRPEVFELGVLPVLSPDKISIENLSRFLQYAKELGNRGFPNITYDDWKNISVKKMNFSAEASMTVFFSCLLFSHLSPGYGRNLEAALAAGLSQQQRDELLGKTSVNTLELVILLYLHRFTMAHLLVVARHTSLQTLVNDRWPADSISDSVSVKQLGEEKHVDFIRTSLSELLSLLTGQIRLEETRRRGDRRRSAELLSFMKSAGVLGEEIVHALGFIIGHSVPQNQLFEQWVYEALDWAPHGEWLCSRQGRKQSWPMVTLNPQNTSRIFTTTTANRQKLTLLSDMNEALTLCRGESDLPTDLKILRCTKSIVYILQPLRCVLINKCVDTRIVLGPVSGRIRMNDCRNCVVVCAARSVVINDCRGITFHTMTPQRPLIVGSRCQGITLGPLNVYYDRLKQHLGLAEMHSAINVWNRPLHLWSEGTSLSCNFDVMEPENFNLIVLPFSEVMLDGRPPILPPGLPREFAKSVEASSRCLAEFRDEVSDANLTPEQRTLLQKSIDCRFKAWLKETSKQRELDLLKKLGVAVKYERVTKTTAI